MSEALETDRLAVEPLFEPFTCGSLTVANRFVMSPMTREMSPDNVLNDQAAAYYSRRAQGGAGLIITEGTAIPHSVAHQNSKIPNFYGDNMERWRGVADAVHAAGGKIFPQLWHAGLFRSQDDTLNPEDPNWAPSEVGKNPVRPMGDSEIADVIAAYGTAAEEAMKAGFDGVNIHGAHGYLPDQFFWPSANRRTDEYGGELEQRVRFAVELISEVRRRTRPDYPIMFRFSQWKAGRYDYKVVENPKDLERWLCPLADAGVDIFDPSTRRFWEPAFADSEMGLAGWTKKVTGKASMTVGSVGLRAPLQVGDIADMPVAKVSLASLKILLDMFNRGEFDLVAIGRSILTNPDWPNFVKNGELDRIRPYNPTLAIDTLECGEV